MKAKRLLAVIALMLCASMLFVSCKKDEDPEPTPVEEPLKLSDIFNMDWKKPSSETALTTQKAELKLNMANYAYVDNLIIYTDSEDYNITRVYDYVAQKELLALTNSITSQDNVNVTYVGATEPFPATVYTHVNNYVYAPSGKNLVVLTVTHKSLNDYIEDHETVQVGFFDDSIYNYVYDAEIKEFSATYDLKIYNTADLSAPTKTISSNAVKSWLNAHNDPYNSDDFDSLFYNSVVKDLTLHLDSLSSWDMISEDLITTDGKVYRIDEDGNLTFVRDIELSKIAQNYTKGEKYYYYFDYTSMTVYDSLLNPVSSFDLPTYVDTQAKFFPLNDGNVLVQYKVEEDEDGDVYDYIDVYSGRNFKYSLYTFIVSAADGTATEIDANYLIDDLYTAYIPYSYYSDYYNPEISNIAEIYYIVDSKLENASTDLDIVSLDNNGNIVKSLKIYDDWSAIPHNMGNGYFSASTVHGTEMIMDKDGKIVSNSLYYNQNSYYEYLSNYTITNTGIYDVTGKKVYNWTDIPCEYDGLDYERNTVLIKILGDDGTYKLDLFNNGTVTTIGTMDATGGAIDSADMITDYDITSFGFYTVSKNSEGKNVYKYYNAVGVLVETTTEYPLYRITSFEGVCVYRGTVEIEGGTQTVYYRFS